jgi:hypothetical protein
MKKNLPLSKIPNDIKYRLGLVDSRLADIGILLASLDPTAWPAGEHLSLIAAVDAAVLRLAAVQAARPRKRTEAEGTRDAVVEAVVAQEAPAQAPVAADLPTLDAALEAPVAVEEPALEAAPEATVEEARRARKRERDRLSAARRRADRLDARAESQA